MSATDGGESRQRRRTVFFKLGEDDGWGDSVPHYEKASTHVAPEVAEQVNPADYFLGGMRSRRQQAGSFHLLEVELAPHFILPRHHHNVDQLVIVLEGEARQGNRSFGPGEGYFTPAFAPYSTSAGPAGCRLVEVRSESIDTLETFWDEARPERWAREVWDKPGVS